MRSEQQGAVVERRAPCRSPRTAGSRARSPRGRTGRRSGRARGAGGTGRESPRAPYPRRRTSGIDPHLLELHGRRRPGRRLGLEQDHAVLHPEPRSPLLDLAARAPAEAVGVAAHRVDPELLLVRRRARGHEELEVVERRRAQPGLARRRGLADDEDRLAGTVLARAGAAASCAAVPELRRPRAPRRSASAAPARATSRANAPHPSPDGTALTPTWHSASSSPSVGARDEAAEPAPGDVLEEDALDGILARRIGGSARASAR